MSRMNPYMQAALGNKPLRRRVPLAPGDPILNFPTNLNPWDFFLWDTQQWADRLNDLFSNLNVENVHETLDQLYALKQDIANRDAILDLGYARRQESEYTLTELMRRVRWVINQAQLLTRAYSTIRKRATKPRIPEYMPKTGPRDF